jgi:hypothetical protein
MPSMDQALALRAEDALDAMTAAFVDEDQGWRTIVHEERRTANCEKYPAEGPQRVRCELRPLWSDSGTRVSNQVPCSAKNVVGPRIGEYSPCGVPFRAAQVCAHARGMVVPQWGRSSRRPARARGHMNAIHPGRWHPALGVARPRHGIIRDEPGGCGRARGGGRRGTEVSFDVRQSCGNEWRAGNRVAMRVSQWK